ncbi:MAG TPA: hypothetical protein VGF80_09955 [Galbitalea sp.]
MDDKEGARGAAPFRRAPVSGAAALVLFLAFFGIGAARVPGSAPEALCIPLLMNCSTPSPTPTPTPTKPSGGLLGGLLGGGSTATGGGVLSILDDPNAPVMTLPAAQLGGSSLSFTGLQSVTLVTIPLANGNRVPVIRLAADSITINNFLLDVRRATGPSLVTTAGQMVVSGHVVAYLDSVTGTTVGGLGLTLGTDETPPPSSELPSQLLRVNLGLVGIDADHISFTNQEQQLHG